MTGPPYPHPSPAPGSNIIGGFVIGVSPIGDITAFDPWATIISQYANSPILDAMITSFNAAVDETQNLDSFFDLIWNVLTAQGYGLDVWGRIVGVNRSIAIPAATGPFFGFQEASSWQGFGGGTVSPTGAPFYAGQALTGNITLTDTDFRRLILAKASANISNGSIQSTNAILSALFAGRGTIFIQDNQNMTATIVASFPLNVTDVAVLQIPGLIPFAAGVASSTFTPPSWMPTIGGIPPLLFADTTTEGGTNHYFANGTMYGSFAAWLAVLGGSFSNASANRSYIAASGVLTFAGVNVPRFEYDAGSLYPVGLLFEGASTNSALQSDAFTTTWTLSTTSAIAANQVGPDSVTNSAWTLTAGATSPAYFTQTLSLSGTTWTASIFGKVGTDNFEYIGITDAGGILGASFNVSAGTVGTIGWNISGAPTGAMSNAQITRYANGFFRISVTWTGSTPTALRYGVADANGSATVTSGRTGIFYGAQMEALGGASSYIPTTTATVTRAADIITDLPITPPFTIGTLQLNGTTQNINASQIGFGFNDLTVNNAAWIIISAAFAVLEAKNAALSQQLDIGQAISTNIVFRAAGSLQSNNFAISVNGAAPTTSVGPLTIPAGLTELTIGGGNVGVEYYGHIRQVSYWNTPANNAQLQTLTA